MAAFMNVISVCRRALQWDHASDTYGWVPHSASVNGTAAKFVVISLLFRFFQLPSRYSNSSPTHICTCKVSHEGLQSTLGSEQPPHTHPQNRFSWLNYYSKRDCPCCVPKRAIWLIGRRLNRPSRRELSENAQQYNSYHLCNLCIYLFFLRGVMWSLPCITTCQRAVSSGSTLPTT